MQVDATLPSLHIKVFFFGAVTLEPWRRLWKTWAPAKCKMFLWLAIRNRCWMADRLAKRGLSHPDKCPICDQADETIQHLSITCVVARQVWFRLFTPLNLADSVPRQNELSFADWWHTTISRVSKEHGKGVNTLIILEAWIIWKHRNACVFEGASPSPNMIWSWSCWLPRRRRVRHIVSSSFISVYSPSGFISSSTPSICSESEQTAHCSSAPAWLPALGRGRSGAAGSCTAVQPRRGAGPPAAACSPRWPPA